MTRQVYGKKTRTIYDPFAAFGSPSSSSPDTPADVKPVSKPRNDGRKTKRTPSQREALGEKNVNTVAQPGKSITQPITKKKGARCKQIGDRDHDDADKKRGTGTDGRDGRSHKLSLDQCTTEQSTMSHVQLTQNDVVNLQAPSADGQHDISADRGQDEEVEVNEDATIDQPIVTFESQEQTPNTPSITVLPPTLPASDTYSDHCANLLRLSNHALGDFAEWSNELSCHFAITKIAEASFGEVYRLSLLEQLPGFSSSDESVFKVIALKPPQTTVPLDKRKREAEKKRIDAMSKPDDVANEVRLLQRMSIIPGFTNFRDVRVVKGRPPAPFIEAFKAWNVSQKARQKDASHFPDPAKKGSYADDQLWAVIEMQDAGTDLECLIERGGCSSIWYVWDTFWQVVLSLAKGEEGAEFEHRDLHLGNICVRDTIDFDEKTIETKRKLNFTGIETTIIDYTISRAHMPDSSVAYQDLSRDSGLFEGDSTEEYQYDIYRYMRGAVLANDAYAEPHFSGRRPGRWVDYHPVTNSIWLHFILYKLLEQTDWPSASKPPLRKQKEAHARCKRASDLEHVLLRVQDLLDPAAICNEDGLKSATALVGLALGEGWLDAEDVVGDVDCEAPELDQDDLAARLAKVVLRSKSSDELAAPVATNEPLQAKHRVRRKPG